MELHKINKQIFWFCKMAFFAEVANVGWLKQRHKIKLWEQIFICLRNYFCSKYKDYWFLAWKHHRIIHFSKMKSSIILTNCCKLSFHTVCRNLTEELWFYVSRVIAKNALGFMAWWTTIFWEAGQNETKKKLSFQMDSVSFFFFSVGITLCWLPPFSALDFDKNRQKLLHVLGQWPVIWIGFLTYE